MKLKSVLIFLIISMILLMYSSELLDAKPQTKKTKKDSVSSESYVVPQRMIIASPYVSVIYAKDLFQGAVEDQTGFGGGLNFRTQIYGEFGYMLDAMVTNIKVIKEDIPGAESQKESDLVAILTGGFYYSLFCHSLSDLRIDLCYGAITAGNQVMTIFVPGVEFFQKMSNRVTLFAKLGWLITNDWIVDSEYKEKYTSFSLSAGLSVIF